MGESSGDTGAPATLAEIVDDLNHQAKNSDLILTFYPRDEGGGEEPPSGMSSPASRGVDGSMFDPVEVTVPMAWVFQDMLYGSTIPVELYARPARASVRPSRDARRVRVRRRSRCTGHPSSRWTPRRGPRLRSRP